MASKRMFSKDITGSDAFLEMPASSQALYFHLGMEADDDGFIGNPKRVMKAIIVSEDDLKILVSKRFVLLFDSGVLVIKHHRINNKWDKYNCRRTLYLEEFSKLYIKENRAYTLDSSQGVPIQSDYSLKTVSRIEENRRNNTGVASLRIEKYTGNENAEERPKTASKYPHSKSVFSWFPKPQKSWSLNTTELKHAELLWERGEESVRGILGYVEKHKAEDFFPKVTKPSDLERKWADIVEYADRT